MYKHEMTEAMPTQARPPNGRVAITRVGYK